VVNEFILKRGNILNAQHLPPKLVQFVCCRCELVRLLLSL
jgi:DNA repair and recombination RAD54-like protein